MSIRELAESFTGCNGRLMPWKKPYNRPIPKEKTA
jgi:hypothetical protein